MLKKIFNTKRKRQEPGRHNTNKITLDPASATILSRHFSPLSLRAKSPSDLLDIVGFPLAASNVNFQKFSQSSPDLTTSLNDDDGNSITTTPAVTITASSEPTYRLTIRNMTTPLSSSAPASPDLTKDQLLETSREDKTLVERDFDHSMEVYRLRQKLLEFENEREAWNYKLRGYIEREEQMRKIIQLNQLQINQLKYGYSITVPSRYDLYPTTSTRSFSWQTETNDGALEEEEDKVKDQEEYEDEDEEEEEEAEEESGIHYDAYHQRLLQQQQYHQYQYRPSYQYFNKGKYYDYHYYSQPHQQRYQFRPTQQQQQKQQHYYFYHD
ncbi:hypothetical protein [Parasitella parasitica]|uniref:Uncharacterized protein n=1 Tax=Parasitella parasitica TaxID=35722 RepID=A0A0B7N2C0_9FUNG|nr:hypothetical protein [Parasitella parasitica]